MERYQIYLRWSDEDRAYVAEVPDLPGCMADGKTPAAAVKAAERAIELWLEVARDEKRRIPEPSREEASGKFVVRVPKSLHRRLQLLARMENVSLNQLVTSLLAEREAEKRSGR